MPEEAELKVKSLSPQAKNSGTVDTFAIHHTMQVTLPRDQEEKQVTSGRKEALNQTHIGKWLQTEMVQRMRKKKLSHLVEDTHESVPKTKILYQPHELKEMN